MGLGSGVGFVVKGSHRMSVLQCWGGQRLTNRLKADSSWPNTGYFLLLRNSKILDKALMRQLACKGSRPQDLGSALSLGPGCQIWELVSILRLGFPICT